MCKNCKPRAVFGPWKPWGLLWEDELKETHNFLCPLQPCRPPWEQGRAMSTGRLTSHLAPSRCEIHTIKQDGETFTFFPEHTWFCFKGHSPYDAVTDIYFFLRLWAAKESMRSRLCTPCSLCWALPGEPAFRDWRRCRRDQWPLNRSWRESVYPVPQGEVSLNFKALDWDSALLPSFSSTFRGNWSIRSDYSTNAEPFPPPLCSNWSFSKFKGIVPPGWMVGWM